MERSKCRTLGIICQVLDLVGQALDQAFEIIYRAHKILRRALEIYVALEVFIVVKLKVYVVKIQP